MEVYNLIYIIGGLLISGGIIIANLSKREYIYLVSILGVFLMFGNFIFFTFNKYESKKEELISDINQIKEEDKNKKIVYIEILKEYQTEPIKYSELLKLDAFDQLKDKFSIDNNINSTDEVLITLYKHTYDELIKRNIWGIIQLIIDNE